MKIKIAIFALAAAAVLGSGCKKTTTTTVTPSLGGLGITEPAMFVEVGHVQELAVDVDDMYVSDNSDPGTLGVYWTVNNGQRDTTTLDVGKSNPSFPVKADAEGKYTVTANVFALNKKYYNASISATFEAIYPETALTGFEGQMEEIQFGGDKQLLYTAPIGTHTWLCENLFTPGKGIPYQHCQVVSDLFGHYYSWEEAQTACPDGWRLPTAAEFDQDLGTVAGDLMADASFQKAKMWPYWRQVTITNQYKFNAIPVGYMDSATTNETYGYKEYACWWTSDTVMDQGIELGVYRYIFAEEPAIKKGKGSKETLLLSVRCVKE